MTTEDSWKMQFLAKCENDQRPDNTQKVGNSESKKQYSRIDLYSSLRRQYDKN